MKMGLSKTGYETAIRGRTSEKVPLNEDGNIAQAGEAIAGNQQFSINAINADNNLSSNHNIIQAFMDFVGGQPDQYTNKMTVSWEAD